MTILTKNERETIALGKKFAKTLKGGEVILLIGGLGEGKTTFVKGVAEGLGIKKNITSPTFVLMRVYLVKKSKKQKNNPSAEFTLSDPAKGGGVEWAQGDKNEEANIKKLVHIDAYRGLNVADLENIGALEYFGRKDTACFVEWGEKLEKLLKKLKLNYYKIEIKHLSKSKRRFIIQNLNY
ncbi:tRNA (adenosine(37)-N6)-threonylcarbamoyltransferase complex ATPase subunit type 1 TsaE [Candidatus Falkowbacteria bacterium]|nr:tRNA (adenosine(37)-N6)-threonylcarbamoyltransferase complex ATPase subunit type 1 TsaE [Candidatus Falkowbacteria bacterium]